MYSRAGLFEVCFESRTIGRVPATHESAGESSEDAKMETLGSTSHVRIRVIVMFFLAYHDIYIVVFIDDHSKAGH